MVDSDGYWYILSRNDDIINVAGHRLSTGAIEELISQHPSVAECAVVGMVSCWPSLSWWIPWLFFLLTLLLHVHGCAA